MYRVSAADLHSAVLGELDVVQVGLGGLLQDLQGLGTVDLEEVLVLNPRAVNVEVGLPSSHILKNSFASPRRIRIFAV